ncbi:MAG TPA: hypothetical protein VM884_08495 [Flavisolibacter sp.]|nr:hypothetical protein [Flavisolibacter sp.]
MKTSTGYTAKTAVNESATPKYYYQAFAIKSTNATIGEKRLVAAVHAFYF